MILLVGNVKVKKIVESTRSIGGGCKSDHATHAGTSVGGFQDLPR